MPRKYLSYKVWYTWNNLASTDHLVLYELLNHSDKSRIKASKLAYFQLILYCACLVSKMKKKVSPEITTQKVCNIMFLYWSLKFCLFVLMRPLWRHSALNLKHVFKSIHSTLGELSVLYSEIDHTKNLLLMTSHKL